MFPGGRQAAVLTGKLSKLSVPLLTIWGGEDQVVPAAQAEALRGHGRVEVLAGSGHSPHMEAANQVNHLVQSFLNQAEGEAT
jgi:pyruvate dehydrogenase E2 component (dihydrolipoyllysine-residue acetyltransferase)